MLTVDDEFDSSFVIKNIDNFNGNDFYISNFQFKPLKPISTATTEPNVVDTETEQFLADVWVGIVLTLMVLSCVCFMCTCFIYHKFQQWKSRGKIWFSYLQIFRVLETVKYIHFISISTVVVHYKNRI